MNERVGDMQQRGAPREEDRDIRAVGLVGGQKDSESEKGKSAEEEQLDINSLERMIPESVLDQDSNAQGFGNLGGQKLGNGRRGSLGTMGQPRIA